PAPDNRGASPLHQPIPESARRAEDRVRSDPGHPQNTGRRLQDDRVTPEPGDIRFMTPEQRHAQTLVDRQRAADPHYGSPRSQGEPAERPGAEPARRDGGEPATAAAEAAFRIVFRLATSQSERTNSKPSLPTRLRARATRRSPRSGRRIT